MLVEGRCETSQQERANYSPWAKSDHWPAFVNKVLLGPSQTHLLTVVCGFHATAAERSSCRPDPWDCKTVLPFNRTQADPGLDSLKLSQSRAVLTLQGCGGGGALLGANRIQMTKGGTFLWGTTCTPQSGKLMRLFSWTTATVD